MKEYTNSNAKFSNKIQILETSDTNHADNINTTTRQLLDNTVANNREIETVKNKLGTVEAGAGVNVQPDWNVTDQNSDAYIKNKPSTFPASAHSHDDKYYPKATVDSKLSEKANSTHTHNYAPASHTHSDYAKTNHTHNYAPASHTHSNYAAAEHTHSGFAATTHTHSNYALTAHTHNYASANHTHDENYYTKATVDSKLSGKASSTHTHSNYASSTHKHDDDYATKKHDHSDYATTKDVQEKYLQKDKVNSGLIMSDTGFEIFCNSTNRENWGSMHTGSTGMKIRKSDPSLEIYSPPVKTYDNSGNLVDSESVSLRLFGCAQKLVPYCAKETRSTITLGSSTNYFDTIYYKTKGTTSDRNLKKNISALSDDRHIKLFDKLLVSVFQYKGTNPGMTEPDHTRYHLGVIAQDLEDWIRECGLDDMEFSPVKSTFFIPNTSDNRIAGGWRAPYTDEETGITYDYSENVWNYKHDREYQMLNEVMEMPVSKLEFSDYRENIQYLMIEDNAKVMKEHCQPPVKINSVHLVDKEGNLTQMPLNLGGLSYYEQDDQDFSNPLSGGIYDAEEDSITITFDKMYGAYLLKISEQGIRLKDYESIIIDVDFIGEYKMYFLPKCEMVNANVWDRKRNPKLIYDYAVDYEQLYLTAMYVLQETRKEFKQYKSDTEQKFAELDQRIAKMEGGE